MPSPGFRVVIAGGSIAGLSLALALEHHGIDFLVLEAYPEIAAQVGASIAILPSGFRILDQLDCYEDVMRLVNCTIDNFIIRDADGKKLIHVEHLEEHLIERYVGTMFSARCISPGVCFLLIAIVLLKTWLSHDFLREENGR